MGILWIGIGVAREASAWGGLGGGALVLGFILLIIRSGLRKRSYGGRIKNVAASSLVISPRGLALVQGPIQGEMEWDELKNVKMINNNTIAGAIIQLDFGDVPVLIFDVYDYPITTIYKQIRDYWR